jgi:hypothetical protein
MRLVDPLKLTKINFLYARTQSFIIKRIEIMFFSPVWFVPSFGFDCQ